MTFLCFSASRIFHFYLWMSTTLGQKEHFLVDDELYVDNFPVLTY